MGSTKMSKILILGALDAEKLQKPRWQSYCETPCTLYVPSNVLSGHQYPAMDSMGSCLHLLPLQVLGILEVRWVNYGQ